jgi:phosphoribosylformylglycinamidine synthase
MKFGVVVFPGSNCDEDMVYVLRHRMKQPVVKLWHKDHDLQNCDFIVLPGGFSYGDYLRSGAIARFSPIMQEVIAFANKGGFVFGVCNGFQILCEAGLVPGALLRNDHSRFNCENVYVRPEHQAARLTAATKPEQALKIPIAHGEGRYYTDAETLRTDPVPLLRCFRTSDTRSKSQRIPRQHRRCVQCRQERLRYDAPSRTRRRSGVGQH